MSTFQLFLPLAKVDTERRTVSGYASTPTRDSDGEIITLEAIKGALPDYMEYGNIREMHALKAVGVAQEANIDTNGLFLTAKIVDDGAWKKCVEGVYKGFSIGGRKLDKVGSKITALEMTEISVVDRPANPDCRITVAKSAKKTPDADAYLLKVKSGISPEGKALAKMAKVVANLAKAGPPAAHDGFSLPAKPTKKAEEPKAVEVTQKDAGGEDMDLCEKHKAANCALCAVEKAQEATGKEPYGDVEYADPGYQSDKKKRYPIDTEEHIRAAWNYINKPKNAAKYGENAGKVKAKIVAAWKAKIDKEGPPSAAAAKLAKLALFDLGVPSLFSPLQKGMNAAGTLSYCFDTVRDVQRRLMMEAKNEGGDKKDKALAKQLGTVAKQLAEVIAQKATHEGGEALDMSDGDDKYLASMLGEGFAKMSDVTDDEDVGNAVVAEPQELSFAKTGDPLVDALGALLKRASGPTKAQRMGMAMENAKKSRRAMKAARSAIEEAAAMHKAAYIAKAAGKKGESKDDEFDHVGAMEKLQKAYAEITKARTFNKAVSAQLEKMSHVGQRGQEAGDAEAGFYEVPPGVKDLSSADLATALPGGTERGSMPPMYPTQGEVYPGKAAGLGDLAKFARNGHIPANVVQLLLEKGKAEGELEALRRLPAAAVTGARRPYAFDLTKMAGETGKEDLSKTLFEGVNVNAFGSGDEALHTQEAAKAIGNFLTSGRFAKSMFDPTFQGAAGTPRR